MVSSVVYTSHQDSTTATVRKLHEAISLGNEFVNDNLLGKKHPLLHEHCVQPWAKCKCASFTFLKEKNNKQLKERFELINKDFWAMKEAGSEVGWWGLWPIYV